MAKKARRPRRGSLQFWPRVRARRIYPRIRSWPKIDNVKLLAFPGYKVGMTHLIVRDTRKYSHTKGEEIFMPVTVIECPPINIIAVRFYRKTSEGLRCIGEIWSSELPPHLKRKIPTLHEGTKGDWNKYKEYDEVRVIVCTSPWLTGIGKKKPEVIEIGLGGNPNEKLEYAKNILGKQVTIKEVFQEGSYVDVCAVTKGKGFQGAVKRFGVKILSHKTKGEAGRRRAGTKGPWTPSKLDYRRPLPGQLGFHTRTEYNKLIVKIGDDFEKFNPKGGWPHYGILRNPYVLLKGSVPGPKKRLIIMREAIREPSVLYERPPEILYTYFPGS